MAISTHNNAAIYCRVSTRQQAEDGSSLDSQEVACQRLAASQGFTVTQVFKEDFPGTELARPLLDQLRAGVKSGTYAAVYCYATDRLSRSPVHLALIAEECQKCEVGLVFVTEPLDSSPEGQLFDLRARLGGPARAADGCLIIACGWKHSSAKTAQLWF